VALPERQSCTGGRRGRGGGEAHPAFRVRGRRPSWRLVIRSRAFPGAKGPSGGGLAAAPSAQPVEPRRRAPATRSGSPDEPSPRVDPYQETLDPMKTFSAKPAEVTHEWFVIDATDKVLGRLASEVALRLRGKHKAIYTPHVDTGDFIVVVNAEKIRVTGNKATDKVYYRHSGFPGGIYATKFKDMQARHPGRALQKAVKGMLPKGPLGYAMVKKLKVYAGPAHPHQAQQPKSLEI
jgi:large subunit ribosomal protein L13